MGFQVQFCELLSRRTVTENAQYLVPSHFNHYQSLRGTARLGACSFGACYTLEAAQCTQE